MLSENQTSQICVNVTSSQELAESIVISVQSADGTAVGENFIVVL